MALVPEWGNTCEFSARSVLPAGTTAYYGSAAPQPITTNSGYTIGELPGGGSQVYIPKFNDMYIVFIIQNSARNNY